MLSDVWCVYLDNAFRLQWMQIIVRDCVGWRHLMADTRSLCWFTQLHSIFFFPRFPSYRVSLQWMLRKGLHFTLQIVFNLAGSSCNGESWAGFLFVWANGFGLDVGGGFVSFPEVCWSYWCNGCCWMLQLGAGGGDVPSCGPAFSGRWCGGGAEDALLSSSMNEKLCFPLWARDPSVVT